MGSMTPVRLVSDDERRIRLARRHALAPSAHVDSVEAVTRAMTVLHATEPATVHLACRARAPHLSVDDVDTALYEERSVVKQLAMRRTLFVFPRDLLPAAWGSASARTARAEGARMAKDAVLAGLADDGEAWLAEARRQVLELLEDTPDGLPAVEIRTRIPLIDVKVAVSAGAVWSASRVLTHLGATGDLMRAANAGHWRTSRPAWTLTKRWLGDVEPAWSPDDGYREIVRRWLTTFGPGTEDDLVWFLGATKGIVRRALSELEAVPVSLHGGATGWLLPDDVEPPASDVEPWAALLPVLDPTVMGWKGRDFYLGPHGPLLFDRNGNAGTTAWVDGRVVGCWIQDDAGEVCVHLCEQVDPDQERLLATEAARLTTWLDGVKVGTVYPSVAMKNPPATVVRAR